MASDCKTTSFHCKTHAKLDIGRSPTSDTAGVSPEIGIIYTVAMLETVIMDFADRARSSEIFYSMILSRTINM